MGKIKEKHHDLIEQMCNIKYDSELKDGDISTQHALDSMGYVVENIDWDCVNPDAWYMDCPGPFVKNKVLKPTEEILVDDEKMIKYKIVQKTISYLVSLEDGSEVEVTEENTKKLRVE